MSSDIILVKHADPAIVAGQPPPNWSLSPEGRARCGVLAHRLTVFDPARVVSSDEAKAVQTAELIAPRFGVLAAVDPGLRENDRRGVPFYADESEFRRRVREFFERPTEVVFGSETADQAFTRFSEAVVRQAAAGEGGTTVLVSHGAVISLFVSRANDIDVTSFWAALQFTSFAVLDPGSFVLKRAVHP